MIQTGVLMPMPKKHQTTKRHTWCSLMWKHEECCQKHGIQTYFKGGNTIKSLLMTPKDKDHITKKSGIIYRFKCNRVDCDDEYIGESSRTFGERYKEHLKAPPQYMTIITSQVMKPALKILALWGGRNKTSLELLKKQFILGWTIHP